MEIQLPCKKCNKLMEYYTFPKNMHIQANCKTCNSFIQFIKQPKTIMPYETKPGDVTIFKNNTENPKAPQYTGTCLAPDGTTYRISLWVKEGAKGKFFAGRMEEPLQKPSGPRNTYQQDDQDIPF